MEWLSTLGVALGASWLSGFRLYACVAALGISGHYGWARLPGELHVLNDPRVWGVASALAMIEFIADKIALVDTTWDAIHTFIRIPAGAILAFAAFADFDPWVKAVAVLAGGGVALTAHGAKLGTRVVVNHSPEPVSNVVTSTTEDAVAGFSLVALILVPIVMIAVVGIAVVMSWWIFRKVQAHRARKAGAAH